MSKREFAAWITVAFLLGSSLNAPKAVANSHYNDVPTWALRNAMARLCEATWVTPALFEAGTSWPQPQRVRTAWVHAQRCWR